MSRRGFIQTVGALGAAALGSAEATPAPAPVTPEEIPMFRGLVLELLEGLTLS